MATPRRSAADQLARFPADRYPVQHALAQFHLATALLTEGKAAEAEAALRLARDIFTRVGMRPEEAKAALMLGVAQRGRGDLVAAEQTLAAAARALTGLGQPLDAAAAVHNLALVRRDAGDPAGACAAWERAGLVFRDADQPGAASSAERERGATLLTTGESERAVPVLHAALELAERAGDLAGVGAAANLLGLAHLALGQSAAAVTAFERAVAAWPRSLRPGQHAMAKANLALGFEQAGEPARARLAARQALGVPDADPPVRAQARALLARLGNRPDDPEVAVDSAGDPSLAADLAAVLTAEPVEAWPRLVREELIRWLAAAASDRAAGAHALIEVLLRSGAAAYDLAEALLGALLEQPPDAFGDLVPLLVTATGKRADSDRERVQSVVRSAMARFPLPQWQRLAAHFSVVAESQGQIGSWR